MVDQGLIWHQHIFFFAHNEESTGAFTSDREAGAKNSNATPDFSSDPTRELTRGDLVRVFSDQNIGRTYQVSLLH